MTTVLVLADGREDGGEDRATCALLTLARRLGTPAVALARRETGAALNGRRADTRAALNGRADIGPALAERRETRLLAEFGAATIYPVAAPATVTARVEMLVELARRTEPAAILIASGRDGLEIAGRVAVRLDSGLLSDVVDVRDGPVAVQSVPGGSYLVESRVTRGIPILAVRTEQVALRPAPVTPAVHPVRMRFPESTYAVREISARRRQLCTAAVIVAGGRGVGSRDAFDLVHRLAAALGGVAGGSHTATGLGWCPRDAQVDQVGTIVHPSLYLGLGVSGSLRHRAGMRDAATIVAIDRDPAAPIFEIADLGVVGDVHQVVPELLAEIERRRAQPVISTREA